MSYGQIMPDRCFGAASLNTPSDTVILFILKLNPKQNFTLSLRLKLKASFEDTVS